MMITLITKKEEYEDKLEKICFQTLLESCESMVIL